MFKDPLFKILLLTCVSVCMCVHMHVCTCVPVPQRSDHAEPELQAVVALPMSVLGT